MKIGIQTWGSDGDIRPFIALAGGLAARGHNVTLALTSIDNKDYSQLAQSLKFNLIRVFNKTEINSEVLDKIKRHIFKNTLLVKQLAVIIECLFKPAIEEMYAVSKRLCEDNDIVIGHWLVYTLCIAAEKLNTPYITIVLNHMTIPSRYVTPVGFPNFGRWLNPFWWKAADIITNRILKPYFNGLRIREGLPAVDKFFINARQEPILTNIIAVSPVFCQPRLDWGNRYRICGFFNMPDFAEGQYVPNDLFSFIKKGEPPAYVTFGSLMPFEQPDLDEAIKLIIYAAHLAKCRIIIQSPRENIPNIFKHNDVYHIGKAQHSRVFPYCPVIVHHGGAGTTQSAARAGCPSVVVPHIADQVFWAQESKRLGISLNPIPRRSLTAARLAKAIHTAINSVSMKERAQAIGKVMRQQDGVGEAAALIERIMKE